MNKKLEHGMLAAITSFAGRFIEVRMLLDHIQVLEKELKEAKQTEERAVRDLGAAGLELAAVRRTVDQLLEERELRKKVRQSSDDHVFEQYMEFIMHGEYEAADGILLAIEKLAPGKGELLQQMRAVERLPF
ncbi:hypothetical protein [Paenibacillus glycanilyticus]|uniref:hypothetical protein n=1 Tax=Paenibacillus glycanilyticus TaxID=126569 RepID=UPI0019107F5C|nr:hypothetical protein [Paenibacillus glycanilyticus]